MGQFIMYISAGVLAIALIIFYLVVIKPSQDEKNRVKLEAADMEKINMLL